MGTRKRNFGGWVRVVIRKNHLGLEVSAVEGAVGVYDHEGETPLENVDLAIALIVKVVSAPSA